MTKTAHRLGALQLKILKHLWESSESSAAEIHRSVGLPADLAFTTIATMLRKMEQRQLIAHRTDGRAFIYRALVSANEVSKTMAQDLLDRLFEGSIANLMSHLLSTREVSPEELHLLEKLVKENKRKNHVTG
jgi:BlaI family transcriptional regulator, penicillinase repressor